MLSKTTVNDQLALIKNLKTSDYINIIKFIHLVSKD